MNGLIGRYVRSECSHTLHVVCYTKCTLRAISRNFRTGPSGKLIFNLPSDTMRARCNRLRMFVLSGPRNGPTNNRQHVHCCRLSNWLVKRPLSIPQASVTLLENDTRKSIIPQEHPLKKKKGERKKRRAARKD